ncbi:MAG: atpA [Parachlamydiales bacterium]|nr:atpA [Parachlamydiales bacterium]
MGGVIVKGVLGSSGVVIQAFSNLLHVRFEGNIRQGEIAYVKVGDEKLLAEVIEINGNEAKIQVFEDTRNVKLNTPVVFANHLLEAELGPGLLTTIFDGLQNPLEQVAQASGVYLKRGVYFPPLDRKKTWTFNPTAKIGDVLKRSDSLGWVMEGRFQHQIMVPFSFFGSLKITSVAKNGLYTVDAEIARGVDDRGCEHVLTMMQRWPVKSRLCEGKKIRPSRMMNTGMRILDTQFPVMKGGTFCSPGPFGAGKTVMQQHLSKYSAVDIVVLVACGERAGEIVEVLRTFPEIIDPHTNDSLMKRTVMICNTSSMPVAAREASVYMGATIAEYYRQMGLDVLLLADSTSRWAQAMREMSGRLEEIPGEEAFPAYLASRISAFYERSGVIELKDLKNSFLKEGDSSTANGGRLKAPDQINSSAYPPLKERDCASSKLFRTGSLTIGGSISPAGGNFEEPVTQASLAIVGAFHGLSRARSDARRYPAVDPLISWSKYLKGIGVEFEEQLSGWVDRVQNAANYLRKGDEIGKRMEVVGEEGVALEDMVIYLKAELYEICYLQQNAFDKEDCYCPMERQIESFRLIQSIFDAHFHFDTHDEARGYFLGLQNEVRNLNYLPFRSDRYNETVHQIKKMIETKKAVHA